MINPLPPDLALVGPNKAVGSHGTEDEAEALAWRVELRARGLRVLLLDSDYETDVWWVYVWDDAALGALLAGAEGVFERVCDDCMHSPAHFVRKIAANTYARDRDPEAYALIKRCFGDAGSQEVSESGAVAGQSGWTRYLEILLGMAAGLVGYPWLYYRGGKLDRAADRWQRRLERIGGRSVKETRR